MKYVKFSPIFLAGFLTACGGGDGQDEGTPALIDTSISGLAIDGHLARATVFIDSNNDGTRNAWEPFAFTDNQGYYSYNPLTDTDYCRDDVSAELAQYCLRSNTDISSAVIRVDGGYDILTGEPFEGQMARRVGLDPSEEHIDSSVISPLTTLLVNVDDSQRYIVMEAIGISENDLDVDYASEDNINPRLLNTALKVHKTVTVLADTLKDNYDSIGSDFGTPNDASKYVYDEIANYVLQSNMSLDEVLGNNAALASIADRSEESVRALYQQKDFEMPADLGSESNPERLSRAINVASQISPTVDVLINRNASSFTQEEAIGGARVLESLIIKSINENGEDSSLNTGLQFIMNENNADLVTALVQGMAEDDASVSELARNDFSGDDFDSEEEIGSAAGLPEGATPFTQIGGMQLRISDLDLGYAPDHLDDSEVELFFIGDPTAENGTLIACAKHIENAHIDGSLGEGSTRGEIIEGHWSLLGTNVQNQGSYSLLLTLTFLGSTYQSIIKPAGSEMIDNSEYKVLRFDFDGEIAEWHSAEGFLQTSSLPETSDDCEARLPSRIGI